MAQLAYVTTNDLTNLIRTASGGVDVPIRILSATELGLGPDPLRPSTIIDLSSESIRTVADAPAMPVQAPVTRSRVSGHYTVTINGTDLSAGSLWEALREGLIELEKLKPGTLEKLSQVKKRTKRIVARDPLDLFRKPESAIRFSTHLIDGWHFGRNNSADETGSWLQIGAELAGAQLKTNF